MRIEGFVNLRTFSVAQSPSTIIITLHTPSLLARAQTLRVEDISRIPQYLGAGIVGVIDTLGTVEEAALDLKAHEGVVLEAIAVAGGMVAT